MMSKRIDHSSKFGERLKFVRESLSMNQTRFAKSLNIQQSYFSKVESEEIKPGIDFFTNLSEKYAVNLRYLFFEEEPMFLNSSLELSSRVEGFLESNIHVKRMIETMFKSAIVCFELQKYFNIALQSDWDSISNELKKKGLDIEKLQNNEYSLEPVKGMKDNSGVPLGDRIKRIMVHFKKAHKEFAKSLNISESYLYAILSGVNSIGYDLLISILEGYPVSQDFLLHGKGPILRVQNLDLINLFGSEANFKKFYFFLENSEIFRFSVLSYLQAFCIKNMTYINKELRLKGYQPLDL